jgi:hypothetical protein
MLTVWVRVVAHTHTHTCTYMYTHTHTHAHTHTHTHTHTQDNDGFTPLHEAARNNHPQVVHLLINANAEYVTHIHTPRRRGREIECARACERQTERGC